MSELFKVTWSDPDRLCVADWGYTHCVPRVECSDCGVWGESAIEYPQIDPGKFAPEIAWTDRVVSLEELDLLRSMIRERLERPLTLVPGGLLGSPSGTAVTSQLEDFV